MEIVKAHAFGNDFLLLDDTSVPPQTDRPALSRAVCDRHRGLGADGLIFYKVQPVSQLAESGPGPVSAESGPGPVSGPNAVSMALLNADGSYSEVSGNGVRCLAAWIAEQRGLEPGAGITVVTDAGYKRLEFLQRTGSARVFRAAMGPPEGVTRARLDVNGQVVDAVTMRVGNPQCVVLGEVTRERLHSLGAKLAVHPHFPSGTNVELASVEAPGRVRILIWERGVGPTEASGTGACAAAVAAMTYGGAVRDIEVVAPGGSQRVEWLEDGLYLTGSAEIIASCRWRKP